MSEQQIPASVAYTNDRKRNILNAFQSHRLYAWMEANKTIVAMEEDNGKLAALAQAELKFRLTGANVRGARDDLGIAYPGLQKPKPNLTMGELFTRQELLYEAVVRLSRDVTDVSHPEFEALALGFGRKPWGVQ